MICLPCRDDVHEHCEIGCCCQHGGTSVKYLDGAARHALALGRLTAGVLNAPELPRTVRISTNGTEPGAPDA